MNLTTQGRTTWQRFTNVSELQLVASTPHNSQSKSQPLNPAEPAGSKSRLVVSSKFAEYHQDQHDNQHEAETAATVIACPVKRAASQAAKTAKQRDDEYDEQYGS